MISIKRKNIITYFICLIITIIVFIPFLSGHYAGDTYNIQGIGYKNYAINYNLKDGRVFMSLINLLIAKINLPIKTYVFITLFLALVVSNIVVIILKNIIEKYKEPKNLWQEIAITAISYITIFNFMYLDCLNFAESFIISVSVLLFLISADILVNGEKHIFSKSLILVLLAIFCYQATINVFAVFILLFSILKNKNDIKPILKDIARGIIIICIVIIFNFVQIKLVGYLLTLNQNRANINLKVLIENIELTIRNMLFVVCYNCYIYPKYLFVINIIVLSVLVLIYSIINKTHISFIIKAYILIIASISIAFILNILSTSSFNGARTHLPIGMAIGLVLIYLYIESDVFEKKNFINNLIKLFIIIYIGSIIYNYDKLMILQKKNNNLENIEMQQISEYIKDYEEKNNININKIVKVLFLKQYNKQFYEELPKNPFLSCVVRSSEFADKALNVYLNRNLESKLLLENSEKVKEYVNIDKNERGYECINDTLYISVYAY